MQAVYGVGKLLWLSLQTLAESPRLHCAYAMQGFSVNILAHWYYFNFNFEQGTAQGKRLDLNRSSFLQACCQQEEKLVFIHAHLASQVCDLAQIMCSELCTGILVILLALLVQHWSLLPRHSPRHEKDIHFAKLSTFQRSHQTHQGKEEFNTHVLPKKYKTAAGMASFFCILY